MSYNLTSALFIAVFSFFLFGEYHGKKVVLAVALGFAGPSGDFFESICFCAACRYGYGAVDGILETVARERVEHPSINTMLLWRRSVQYGLLQQIREAVGVPLWLRTVCSALGVMMPSSDSMGVKATPVPGASSPYGLPRWRATGCSKREGWP